MNQYQTYKYLETLPKITQAYNNTYHRSIKMKPSMVTETNQSQVWINLHKKSKDKTSTEKMTLSVGDWVRVSNLKGIFDREYRQKWSGEEFQIISSSLKQGRPAYVLQDYAGELITGTFYPEELQKLDRTEDNRVYRIEKIIRTRRYKNRPKEYLVKWLNWGDKWNSWVTENDMESIPKPPP